MAMTGVEVIHAIERADPSFVPVRVALMLPDGSIMAGPVVGIQSVNEDGVAVTVVVALAQRQLVL